MKRSRLPYATYFEKQYDPFLDEDIFEESGREKKLKLSKKNYQWRLADTTPSPGIELAASDSGRGDSISPIHVQEAEDTISSGAIVQSNLAEQDEPLNQSNVFDQNVSEREKDEVMSDEIVVQHLPKVISQAKLDDNEHGLDETIRPNGAIHNSSSQESNGEINTEGVDRQNARAEMNMGEMQEEDASQALPENKPSTPHSRDSPIVRVLVTNGITDELSPKNIDGRGAPSQGKDSPEYEPEMNEDSMEDDQPQKTRSEDGPFTPAHRYSAPMEDMGSVSVPRSRVSMVEKRISPSKSPKSSEEIRSSLSGSAPGLDSPVSPTGDISQDQTGTDAKFSTDLGEDSLISPVQDPYSERDHFSDDQSEIASADDVVYIGSDSDPATKDTQSTPSKEDGHELLNTASAAEDVLGDNLGIELDGPSILQTRSSPSTLLLPGQTTQPSGITSNELERLLPLIDPNIAGTVGPSSEALAINQASFTKPFDIVNTKYIPTGDEITKARETNEIRDIRGSIKNKQQEKESAEIEAFNQTRAPDAISTQIDAGRNGESSGVDHESTIMVLPEQRDRHSLQDNREFENDISSGEDDPHERSDDTEPQHQQDNQTQIIHLTKRTVDIINLETGSEDDVPASPLMKASPAHKSEKATNLIFDHIAVYKQEDDRSGSDGPTLDHFNKTKVADVAVHDAPITAPAVQDDPLDTDSPTYHMMAQSTGPNTPAKDHSRLLQERIFRGQDSKLNSEVDDSPQSKMSELEDEIFRDSDLDPIFRKQLFTPSASQQRSLNPEPSASQQRSLISETSGSQQRSLVSEPPAVSIKSQQDEPKLPTPRLTQSISAPPLPPASPEPQQNPSLVEKIKVLKGRSAKAAQARKSIDHSFTASTWFTHKEKSQLTHISDTEVESENESIKSSNPLPLMDKKPQSKGPIEPSHPKLATYPAPEQEILAPKTDPFPAGFRTSLAYYAPLSTLHSHFNALISVLAIVRSSTPPKRANSGPRDFYNSLSLTDPSSASSSPITAQIFRPKEVAFPATNPGDAILLRNFKVQSFNGRFGLLSTDSSAWAVFRSGEDVQVRGPPVEFGAEERGFARGLGRWWGSIREGKAKAIELKDEEEVVQQPEEKADNEKANIRRSARHQTPRRTRRQQQDNSSDSVLHELRDGTSYTDSTPEKGTRRKKKLAHELRDGTTYTDIDSDGDAVQKKGGGKAKKGGAKEKMKLNHTLRDGTTYSDDVE